MDNPSRHEVWSGLWWPLNSRPLPSYAMIASRMLPSIPGQSRARPFGTSISNSAVYLRFISSPPLGVAVSRSGLKASPPRSDRLRCGVQRAICVSAVRYACPLRSGDNPLDGPDTDAEFARDAPNAPAVRTRGPHSGLHLLSH